MNQTLYYIILVLVFAFGVISQYRSWFLIGAALLLGINAYRYILWKGGQDG